jgi:hypothetical protein
MNTKDPLERLMRSAARAPRAAADQGSFALEARVMAAWRSAAKSGSGEGFVIWLRRATVGAFFITLMTLAWNFHDLAERGRGGDELAVADAAMRVGVEP